MRYNTRMLRHLTVRNYTLIDALDLELDAGLSVITGETGAGKSIVLDALGLALGNRADSRSIRGGAERLEVSASFDLADTPEALAWLRERALDLDGECQLRRVVTRDGRSRAWINGQPATLADIKTLGDQLVDIHGQHEHHSLLSRASQQRLLDEYGGHRELAERVAAAYAGWRDCRDELEALRASAGERRDRQQLLNYQLGELAELALGANESAELEQEQKRLANAGELTHDVEQVLALCEGGEDGDGVLDGLRRACATMHHLDGLGERADTARQLLESAQIQVDEARRELQSLRDGLELDPERLAEVENRLSAIYTLARKHRVAPTELHRLQDDMSSEAAGLDVSDARIEALEEQLQALDKGWAALAAQLGKARAATARSISKRVQEQLAFLGMGSCRFSVAIRPLADKGPSPGGAEQIEFLVATNPGAEPAPLARIASGGELSRISLAIQVIIASRATTPTVIFDEVDVGIGGATADAVGSLLQTLGQRIQVVCVTHLPQVAARGAQHLRASKSSNGESTSAALTPLAVDERVEELARMLGGKTVTRKTQEHAREMLESAAL